MRLTNWFALAALLGTWNAHAQVFSYPNTYSIWSPFDSRIKYNNFAALVTAGDVEIARLTGISIFQPTITFSFPAQSSAATVAKVRIGFAQTGTTAGAMDLAGAYATTFTLPTPFTVPAGATTTIVYNPFTTSLVATVTAAVAPPPPPPPPPPVADITPPVVSITAPLAGATVVGTNSLTASASDNVGVAGVQFLIDGANFSAEITAPPYTTVWNSTTAADGAHTVSAKARDAAGNSSTSAAVSVKVSNAPPPPPPLDTTPPSVSITSPVAGATVSGIVTLTANAIDNVGVVGVQFGLDGANLGVEDTTVPYSITWVTTAVADGPHTLNVVARDAAGNRASSPLVTVTVANALPPPPPSPPPPAPGVSPDGSKITVASGGSLTTAAGVWTFGAAAGAGGNIILLNGKQALSGEATELHVLNGGNLYAFNSFSNWYQWTGTSWNRLTVAPTGAPHP